ncbi:hypothetical protein Ddye_024101 [Dipteronia dyeriana]|uniref:Uncharacterized protein n=1 Tax=Dipteronia dyeriana TaxID=168575 RepID=A0AAD9TV77_9ROSI|nr:hypothetical protein Ddye_024101 [Dipteronia dyeriana]
MATATAPKQLSQKEADIQMMLDSEVHWWTKNCDFQMERCVFNRRNDERKLIYCMNYVLTPKLLAPTQDHFLEATGVPCAQQQQQLMQRTREELCCSTKGYQPLTQLCCSVSSSSTVLGMPSPQLSTSPGVQHCYDAFKAEQGSRSGFKFKGKDVDISAHQEVLRGIHIAAPYFSLFRLCRSESYKFQKS